MRGFREVKSIQSFQNTKRGNTRNQRKKENISHDRWVYVSH